MAAAACVVLMACAAVATRQTTLWKNSETLWRRILMVDGKNLMALYSLGVTLDTQGKSEEAASNYSALLKIKPNDVATHNKFGLCLISLGKTNEALSEFRLVLRLDPRNTDAMNHLGNTFVHQGKVDEGIAQLRDALKIATNDAESHFGLGNAFLQQNDVAQAVHHFTAAIEARPSFAEAHYQLAVLLASQRKIGRAIEEYREALRYKPAWLEPLNNLAWILATDTDSAFRDGHDAVRLARRAAEKTSENEPATLDTLAAARAEAGEFTKAVSIAEKAHHLAIQRGQNRLATQIQGRLELYRQGRPYREP
jgi:tetratricopeptide (TPR) repeat protein